MVFSNADSSDQVGHPVPLLQELRLRISTLKAENLETFLKVLRFMIAVC